DNFQKHVEAGRVAIKLDIAQIPPACDQDGERAGDESPDDKGPPVVAAQADDEQGECRQRQQEADVQLCQQTHPGSNAKQYIIAPVGQVFQRNQAHNQQEQQASGEIGEVVVVHR